MKYKFPLIENVSDVLPAIEGRDEFVVAVKEGYTVINYNVMMADTFPDIHIHRPSYHTSVDFIDNHNHMIRRECRGIIFDTATGDILRRPYHKFFNVNEREETQDHCIDLSRPHIILEKLDGSMIAPFVVNGEMIWGTKMGATDVAKPVEEFIKNNPRYVEFATKFINLGWTPIFEWCSRKQRIVLDYKEDQLVLTAMRNTKSGTYSYHTTLVELGGLYDIPVVRAWDIGINMDNKTMKSFVDYVADLEDLEGFVVRFDDGHMLKLKCHWYLHIHKAKEAILQDRNIVELILEEHLDDVKAHLPADDRDRLTQFENDFNRAIKDVYNNIINTRHGLSVLMLDRKTFAIEHAPSYDSYTRPILFKNFGIAPTIEDSHKIMEDIHNTIRNNLTRTAKYEAIRDVWFPGVVYND